MFHPIFNGHAQCIMDFDDRWQEPLSGGYSDCQLLVNIMGHLCELQVNVREMIKAKEGGGHVAYDVYRFVNDRAEINQCVRPAWRYYLLFWPPRRNARVLGVLARGV